METKNYGTVELAGATLKYKRGRTFGKLEGMAPLRRVY